MRFNDDPLDALINGEAKLSMLLVGVNQYQDERLPDLQFAVADCQGLAAALRQATASFPKREVIVHHDGAEQPPTLAAIQASLEKIVEDPSNHQDVVLFYFSGHGKVDPTTHQPFLCLTETRVDDLPNTGLRLPFLLEQFSRCHPSKQLILLDACHSGGIMSVQATPKGDTGEADSAQEIAGMLGRYASQSNDFYALLSCRERQQSWEFSDLRHGAFTYYLIEGLGSQDVLGNQSLPGNKRVIELDRLYSYVYSKTNQCVFDRVGKNQMPKRIALGGNLVVGLGEEAPDPVKDLEKRRGRYREEFVKLIQRVYPPLESDRQRLQQLQQELKLREEHVYPDEEIVLEDFEIRWQTYAETVSYLLKQEYPLGEAAERQLEQTRNRLGLGTGRATQIQTEVTTDYQQKRQVYRDAMVALLRQHYPPNAIIQDQLQQKQRELGLSNPTVSQIQQQVLEEYEHHRQEYEQEFTTAIYQQHLPGPAIYEQLQRLQDILNLNPKDILEIENHVTTTFLEKQQEYEVEVEALVHQHYPGMDMANYQLEQKCQQLGLNQQLAQTIRQAVISSYRQQLEQYEKDFQAAIQQQYPLPQDVRNQLQTLQQHAKLRPAVIADLEDRILKIYRPRFEQYEQQVKTLLHQQCPLSNQALRQLQQLQKQLQLSDENTTTMREQIVTAYERNRQEYRRVVTEQIHQGFPLDEPAQQFFRQLQQSLDLQDEAAITIQNQVTAAYQKKLSNYQKRLTHLVQATYPLSDAISAQFRFIQNELGLRADQVTDIDASVIERYRQQLSQYRDDLFELFTQQVSPPPGATNRLRKAAELKPQVARAIEKEVREAYKKRQQQYREQFTAAVKHQYPLAATARTQLQVRQQILGLNPHLAEAIEQQVIRSLHHNSTLPPLLRQVTDSLSTFNRDRPSPISLPQPSPPMPQHFRLLFLVRGGALLCTVAIALGSFYAIRHQSSEQFIEIDRAERPDRASAPFMLMEWGSERLLAVIEALKQQGKLTEAVNLARQIPPPSRFSSDAQIFINQTEQRWFALAQEYYLKKGRLEAAIAVLKAIPETHADYTRAQFALQKWPGEWSVQKSLFNTVAALYNQQEWRGVINEGNRIVDKITHPYLKEKLQNMTWKAEANLPPPPSPEPFVEPEPLPDQRYIPDDRGGYVPPPPSEPKPIPIPVK